MKFGKSRGKTSRMTLNDRFSNLPGKTVVQVAANQNEASRKNQRLAKQMANRPSVIAALEAPVTQSRRARRGQNQKVALVGARGATQVRGDVQVGVPLRGGVQRGVKATRGQNNGAGFYRPVTGTPQSQVNAGASRGGNRRGAIANQGNARTTTFVRGGQRGAARGSFINRGAARGTFVNRGATRGTFVNRGATRGTFVNRGVTRGTFVNRGATRGTSVNNRLSRGGRGGQVATSNTSIKQRLSVQGRLSQPAGPNPTPKNSSSSNWIKGGFDALNQRQAGNARGFNRGRGGRSFRGRGRGGGFSGQW